MYTRISNTRDVRRRSQAKMPWQSAPSLLIIIGAFNVAAGAMWGIQRIAYGKVRAAKGGAIIDIPSSKSVGRVGPTYLDVLTFIILFLLSLAANISVL